MRLKTRKQGKHEKNEKGGLVFVSVGTHPQQFDRLLKEVDRLAGEKKIVGRVFAQTGHSTYEPKNFGHKKFLALQEFEDTLKKAYVFITHAGEGNVGLAKNLGKKFVCIPRRKEFGEHTNDHQLELAEVVEEKVMGLVAWQDKELEEKLVQLQEFVPARVERGRINKILEDYVKKEFAW